MNRHATVAQLREVLATLRDDDCIHTNMVGNLTVIRRGPLRFDDTDPMGIVVDDDYVGFIELTSGDLNEPPAAVWNNFTPEDRR
jgi:hypothetical protein